MSRSGFLLSCVVTVALSSATARGQQPTISVDGDDVTIRGCVTKAQAYTSTLPDILAWTRGDMMLAAVAAAGPAHQDGHTDMAGLESRVFYWIDHDEDLSKYVGQQVELKGDLDDFETGEIEIRRDGEFTEIELELDGDEETVRVPTAWLRHGGPDEKEFKVVARRIDVDDVRALGPCTR